MTKFSPVVCVVLIALLPSATLYAETGPVRHAAQDVYATEVARAQVDGSESGGAWEAPADSTNLPPDAERYARMSRTTAFVSLGGTIANGLAVVFVALATAGGGGDIAGFALAEVGSLTAAISGSVSAGQARRAGIRVARWPGYVSVGFHVASYTMIALAARETAEFDLGGAILLVFTFVLLKATAYGFSIAQTAVAMSGSRRARDEVERARSAEWFIAPTATTESGGVSFVMRW